MRSLALIPTLSLGLMAGSALAQDGPVARSHDDAPPPASAAAAPQPTAPPPLPARAPSSGDPTQAEIDAWLKADAQPVQAMGEGEGEPLLVPDRRIHGEVGAVVSNRGYAGFASASMPIGAASELDVAVAAGHERTRWGKANPKSIAVGLHLDGGDVGRWLSRDKCHVPRWGVRLKDDPQVAPDGSCMPTPAATKRADIAPPPPIAVPGAAP